MNNTSFKNFKNNVDRYQIIKSKAQFPDGVGGLTKFETAYYIKKNKRLLYDFSQMWKYSILPISSSVLLTLIFSISSLFFNDVGYGAMLLYSFLPILITTTYLCFFRGDEFRIFFAEKSNAEKYIKKKIDSSNKVLDSGEVVEEYFARK